MFSSRSFIVSSLNFRSLIHLKTLEEKIMLRKGFFTLAFILNCGQCELSERLGGDRKCRLGKEVK